MPKFFLVFSLLLGLALGAKSIKIATYNIENLFDLEHNGYEHKEYIPYKQSNWNDQNFKRKLANIAKVIKGINADIIALQEVENRNVLKILNNTLKTYGLHYSYQAISKFSNSNIQVAVLSKLAIKKQKTIFVQGLRRGFLQVDINVSGKPLSLIVNHWRSKRSQESFRITSAKALMKVVRKLKQPYILLGDFNSNYNEFQQFRNNKRLNNTKGITGINHILKTIYNNKLNNNKMLSRNQYLHYNLWLNIDKKQRYSSFYKKRKNTPDAIIIGYDMLDKRGIDYRLNSFTVFKPNYVLIRNRYPKRWGFNRRNHNRNSGFSDHLPIFALFELYD